MKNRPSERKVEERSRNTGLEQQRWVEGGMRHCIWAISLSDGINNNGGQPFLYIPGSQRRAGQAWDSERRANNSLAEVWKQTDSDTRR